MRVRGGRVPPLLPSLDPQLPDCWPARASSSSLGLSSRGHLSSWPIIGCEARLWPGPIDQMSGGGTGRRQAAAQAAVRVSAPWPLPLAACWPAPTLLDFPGVRRRLWHVSRAGGSRCGAAAAADYSSCYSRPQPPPVSPPQPPLKSRNNKHSA